MPPAGENTCIVCGTLPDVSCDVCLLPQSLPLLPDSLTAAFPPHSSLPCQPPSALGNDVSFTPLTVEKRSAKKMLLAKKMPL